MSEWIDSFSDIPGPKITYVKLELTNESRSISHNSMDLHADLLAAHIRRDFIKYVYPLIITTGIICNCLALWVMTTPAMRKNPTSICFAVLSIVDSILLGCSALLYWIWAALEVNVWTLNNFSCKITVFLCYVSVGTSVWIICLITIERFTAVYFPFRVNQIFTTQRSGIIMCVIVILLILIHIPLIGELKVGEIPSVGSECKMEWDPVFYKFFSIFQSTMIFILPYILLVVLNCLIVRNAINAGKQSRMLSNGIRRRITSSSREILKLTLLKNLFFLCGYLPISIFTVSDGLFSLQIHAVKVGDYKTYVNYRLIFQISCTMVFASHASNFFLYLASGQKFRNVFIHSCTGGSRSNTWGHSVSLHNSIGLRDMCHNQV